MSARTDQPFDLLVMFVTADHLDHFQAMAKRLRQTLKPAMMIGCAGMSVIGVQTQILSKPGLSVMAATLPRVKIKPVRFQPGEWGQVLNDTEFLTQQLIADPLQDPECMILLADPYSSPMVSFLPAVKLVAPHMTIVGGMASSGDSPGTNRFILNDQYWFDGAVGITLTGNISASCTLSQGARPIGKPMIVTKADKHVIHELGGKPAIKALNELLDTLGPLDRNLVKTNGVLVGRVINEYKSRFGRGDFLVRKVVGYDDETGVIAINDSRLRVGQTVQFHVQDRDTAVEDLAMLLEVQRLQPEPRGALIFPCTTRCRKFFGVKHTDAELVYNVMGDLPLAGFFAAGEIGPVGDHNFMHSHTVSMVTFRPGKA
jgi:small ligand-binding sensory domain FIST